MPARRTPASRAASAHADTAARRLALLAADLAGPPRALTPVPDPPRGPAADPAAEDSDPATAPGAGADPDPAASSDPDPEGDSPPWWADHTRIAHDRAASASFASLSASPAAAVPTPAAQVVPPALPAPGRHADRRRSRRMTSVLPAAVTTLRDRAPGLTAPHVTVVAVVVALGLAVTTWWVARDRTDEVAPVAARPAAPLIEVGALDVPASGGGEGASAAAEPATVTVDVAGRVRRPGIVVLDRGARVVDALRAAGGARRGVDLTPLNLARVLVDGEQIVVGVEGGAAPASGAPAGDPAGGGPGATGPLVNLNTAAQAELETLPGVGPVTAQAIIAWREQHGGFTSIDELLEVDGIGEKTLATLSPHVTV